MSNGGGFIVIDGSKIRAIDLSLSNHQTSTLTGAQVIEQAESKFSTSLWGVKMLEPFKLSTLDRMGYADHTSFLDAKFDKKQVSVKLKEFFDAAANLLDDDPLVVSILNGSTMQLYLENEDDFAMLAENLFTDLDVEDKGKIRKSEAVRALEHMRVDMGVPPSEFPALNDILQKHGAGGEEELGQTQFAQVLQSVLQELADTFAKNQLIITHSTKVANGCRIKKFWSDLTIQARQELLKIDKQTLFEQARKNMYCSRCKGLLLEGFLQIVMYGKSFQQEGSAAHLSYSVTVASKSQYDGGMCTSNGCKDEIQDPSVHPWGGLTTTRDGSLTLLDCYIHAKSLKGLQIVFDSARVRERERELLYPDACGGGSRGWISQGIATYGRGHGMRETCALHTARLPCDTLVDFWSALSEETRQSLLRMKEEDFIERLMYRFDSKRFCRDCRRNVIREFKELKELKRMRREPRCTSCFCVADTAFQYEVSNDSVLADWHQTFSDSVGSYHHFEWAVGTGEGKSDILEFENVGLSGSAQVSGLDLGGLNACFITLRAWKLDGRCSELFVKAHALKGQQCVHGRLVVGDGFVTITRGKSIRRFFEHAEEAEEEEDDDSMDKDGNDLDGECSRPQKHAKSPELAREFLLDAAIVIFKEQVAKAFREGTARQNAHSIFVCLALKLLEERVHIACKEIITYEKQMKLLEEEEKEKREEEERKERRRAKEREKKLRRKERLKGKEKNTETGSKLDDDIPSLPNVPKEQSLPSPDDEMVGCEDLINGNGDMVSSTSHVEDDAYQSTSFGAENHFSGSTEVDLTDMNDGSGSFTSEQSKHSNGKSKFRKEGQTDQGFKWSERRRYAVVSENSAVGNRSVPRYHNDVLDIHSRGIYGSNRQLKSNTQKTNGRSSASSKCSEKFHYGNNNRMNERYDCHPHPCGCNQMDDYRANTTELPVSAVRSSRESKYMVKSESALDVSKHFYRGSKYNQTDYVRQSGGGRLKTKVIASNHPSKESPLQFRKVWEPLESQKRYSRSNSESDVTLMASNFKAEGESSDSTKSSGELCSSEDSGDSIELDSRNSNLKDTNCETDEACQNEGVKESAKAAAVSEEDDVGLCRIGRHTTVSSSSCLSEVDSNTPSSKHGNPESSSSDSEDACNQPEIVEVEIEPREAAKKGVESFRSSPINGCGSNLDVCAPMKISHPSADTNGSFSSMGGYKNQAVVPQMQQQGQNLFLQMLQGPPSTMGYYPQNLVSWTPFPPPNGLFTHPPNNYVYGGPLTYGGFDGTRGFCVPYDTLPPPPHLTAAPLMNGSRNPPFPNPPSPYQPMAQIPRQNAGRQVLDAVKREETASAWSRPLEAAKNDGGHGQRHLSTSQESSGFSLFHFGGPVALSDMTKSSAVPPPPVEEAGTGTGCISLTDAKDGFHDECNKKETAVEEYNLFSASNGSMRFSIF